MATAPEVLYIPDFWPVPRGLFEQLAESTVWDTRIKARKTASFGVPYNYGWMTCPETPLPEILLPLVAQLTETLGFPPNNCLMNYYPDGRATMGFHRDDTTGLVPGTGVAIVSVGAERTLVFRRPKTPERRVDFSLTHGSLLYMPPEVQESWHHGVPGQSEVLRARISLTFRQIAA